MSERCCVVFTKPAREGLVKTRMIGHLSPQEATALHVALTEDLLERLAGDGFDVVLSWALETDEPIPERWLADYEGIRQPAGDLGCRMLDSLIRMKSRFRDVVAVGVDHPDLTHEIVREGLDRLREADVVLGPSRDGGYYLIGLGDPDRHRAIFEHIPWSTSEVYVRTLERCAAMDLKVSGLPIQDDIDDPADLARLYDRLPSAGLASPRLADLLESWARSPQQEVRP